MEKIAIITLNGYFNYGNRLQNYALQEVLKELGNEVVTIIHNEEVPKSYDTKIVKIYKKLKNTNIVNIRRKIFYYKNRDKILENTENRLKEFKIFSKKNIAETEYRICTKNIPNDLGNKFDYFVAGSDQIWNPLYHYHTAVEPAIEYMTFAPKEKRLSYAASFGLSEIPEAYQERATEGLRGMKSILVREYAGAQIVKQLTGREAHVVLDPTMLLTKDQWLTISDEYEYKPKKPYLLTYFLGDKSKEVQSYISKVARDNNLEIVHLEDLNHDIYYKANPGHFVDFINSAEVMITDSFHGVVFSILMETPFVIFKREDFGPSMYSRIETLLVAFNLQNRAYGSLKNADIFNKYDKNTFTKLNELRTISRNHLIDSF